MPARTIKKLLTLNYAFITIIPFVLILVLTLALILPQEIAEDEKQSQLLAATIDEKIEAFLKEQVYEINKVLFLDLRTQNTQRLLDRIVEESASLNALYLLTPAGIISRCGLSFEHEDALHRDLEGVDMSNSSAYRKAVAERKAVWSDVFMSVVTGNLAIAYALPLKDSYLVGEVSLEELSHFLKRISPADGRLILIADRNGQIIADQDGSYSIRQLNISNLELVQRRSAQQPAVSGALTFEGNKYLGVASPIGAIGWYSLLATPRNVALADAYYSTTIIISGLLLALLLAAVSARLLMKKISVQFGMLTDFANKIALSKKNLDWQGSDIEEFEQVATTLQEMADILLCREEAIMDGLEQIRLDRVRFECLFELSKLVVRPEKDILNYALEAAVRITGSRIGYIYLLNDDESVLTLHAWSRDVMAACSVPSPPSSYLVADTGLWGEAVRQRAPVITNDYSAPDPLKRGCPEGHVRINRHMNLPIFYQGKIVLLAGVGNKEGSYDEEDIHQLRLLLDATWLLIEKKRSEILLRESEARSLQMFQQNSDALVFCKVATMQLIDANPAALRMFGIERAALQRLSLRRVLKRADLVRFFTAIRFGNADEFIEKILCRSASGSSFYVSIKGTIISLKDEKMLFCSIRDITEKIRVEEETRATQAKLIQANKMTSIGLMVSSIAHEINNPNQCVRMNAFILRRVWQDIVPMLEQLHGNDEHFLLDGAPYAEMKQTLPAMIDTIADSSHKINAYILQLLNFAKGNTTGMDEAVDVNRSVENAVSILWYQIRSGTDRFSTQLSGKHPVVRGNAHQLEQVVINLITNALQALPTKTAAITVATDCTAAGNVIIRCSDEGSGMDSATVAKLAEPFFSTRQQQGGTGLGVYISANIIKEHGGTIDYDSTPGSGTTVTISLPAITGKPLSDAKPLADGPGEPLP